MLIPEWVGLCMLQAPVSLSNKLSVRLGVSPAAASTPSGVFNQRFEALFPGAGALGCVVCFAPPLFILVYLCANVGPWGMLPTTLPALFILQSASLWVQPCSPESSPPGCPSPPRLQVWMNVSFFISLVVRLPCGSIFCQFWLFSVFKLSLSFFWLCEEAQCVYLRLHLGRKPGS